MNKILCGSLALFAVYSCSAAEQAVEKFINYINEEKKLGTTNIATMATDYIKKHKDDLSLKEITANKKKIEEKTGLKIKESYSIDEGQPNNKKRTVKFSYKNISDGNSTFSTTKSNKQDENDVKEKYTNPLEKIGQKPDAPAIDTSNAETKSEDVENKILEMTKDYDRKLDAILKKLDAIEKTADNCFCKHEDKNSGSVISENANKNTEGVNTDVKNEQWPDAKIYDVLVKKYPITFGELDGKLDFEKIRTMPIEEVRKISYLTEKCADVFGGDKQIYKLQLPDDNILGPYLEKNYKNLLTPDLKRHLTEQSKFKKVALNDAPVEKSYEIRNYLGHMESAKNEKYRRYIEINKQKNKTVADAKKRFQ